MPGLDIAFYAPRSHYHTPRDDLAHTTPEALQYMGQLALGAVRTIANSDDLIDTSSDEENFIYFDILGRVMFAYSFTTFQIINAFVLFAVPIVAIYLGRGNRTLQDIVKERSHLVIKGLLAILSALFCSILFSGIAAYLMHHANPLMTYGDVNGAALYIFSAVFLGVQISQLILPVKLKQVLATTDAIWYGLVTFWWIFVLFASYIGSKNLASLHFAVHLLFFTALASVII